MATPPDSAPGPDADPQKESHGWKWLLSTPALLVLLVAASGPLMIVAVYSFLSPGNVGVHVAVLVAYAGSGWVACRITFARRLAP